MEYSEKEKNMNDMNDFIRSENTIINIDAIATIETGWYVHVYDLAGKKFIRLSDRYKREFCALPFSPMPNAFLLTLHDGREFVLFKESGYVGQYEIVEELAKLLKQVELDAFLPDTDEEREAENVRRKKELDF